MELRTQSLPMAGQSFRFTVEGRDGLTSIEVLIDSKLVFRHDCDDPPCHEMVMIPPGTRGATLRVIATDSSGRTRSFNYKVVDSDADASNKMTIGGWIILIISVGTVVTLFTWCIYKVLSIPGETEHLHGFEQETPDEKIEDQ